MAQVTMYMLPYYDAIEAGQL